MNGTFNFTTQDDPVPKTYNMELYNTTLEEKEKNIMFSSDGQMHWYQEDTYIRYDMGENRWDFYIDDTLVGCINKSGFLGADDC